jgi:hypothetical protein
MTRKITLGGAALGASILLALPAFAADRNTQTPESQDDASGRPIGYSTINGLGGGDGSTGYRAPESRHWRHYRWHHHHSERE